jgi:hypothetical protein
MTSKNIGQSFPSELTAAGAPTDGFSWTADGVITFIDSVTQAQKDAVNAVLAAHDPAKPAPPVVPEEVTRYQREVVMRRYGIFADADALFMLLPEDDERRIAWLTAPTTKRHSAATLYALQQMNIPDAQADQMFIEAGQVE